MQTVVFLDHFRRSIPPRDSDPHISRAMRAMEGMTHSEQTAEVARVYKTSEREKRAEAWERAMTIYEFYDRLRDVAPVAGRAFNRYSVGDAQPLAYLGCDLDDMGPWFALNDKRRAAQATVLLTPVPTVAALNWKKAVRSSRRFASCELKAATVDVAIARDAAWLAANARRKAVQS